MSKPAKHFIALLSIIILGRIAFINFLYKRYYNKKLLNRHSITNGLVLGCYLIPKSGKSLDVSYMVRINNKNYSFNSSVNGIYLKDFNNYFLRKTFPVIYQTDNPNV